MTRAMVALGLAAGATLAVPDEGWSLANADAIPPRHAPVLNCQSRADVYRSADGID